MNIAKMVKLREEGYAWPAIAKKMKSTIYRVRKAWDAVLPHDTSYKSKRRAKEITPEIIAKAIELRAQGLQWKAVARKLNVGLSCIQKAVYMTQSPKTPPPEVEKAAALRARGLDWKTIGRELDEDHAKLANQVWWFAATAKRQAEVEAGK